MALPANKESNSGVGGQFNKSPLAAELDGKQIVVTPRGQVLVDGERASGLLGLGADVENDDERSGQQVDSTIAMISKVMQMMVWAEPDLLDKMRKGEEKLENVLERAGGILERMVGYQETYEQHRLTVAQLDTAQAALESVSKLARSTNLINWAAAPAEIKHVAKLILEDARRTNAIVLAASVSDEEMEKGLSNFNKMVTATTNAFLEQKMIEYRAQDQRNKLNEASHHDAELKRLERERQAHDQLADWWAGVAGKSSKGLINFADQAAERIGDRLIGEDGILPTAMDGLTAVIDKAKESQVIGFFGGGTLGLATGGVIAVGLAIGGSMAWVPVAVIVGASATGAALGAKASELVERKTPGLVNAIKKMTNKNGDQGGSRGGGTSGGVIEGRSGDPRPEGQKRDEEKTRPSLPVRLPEHGGRGDDGGKRDGGGRGPVATPFPQRRPQGGSGEDR